MSRHPARGQAASGRDTELLPSSIFILRASPNMSSRSWSVMAVLSWARIPAMSSSAKAVLADLDHVVQLASLIRSQPVTEPDHQVVWTGSRARLGAVRGKLGDNPSLYHPADARRGPGGAGGQAAFQRLRPDAPESGHAVLFSLVSGLWGAG